MFEVYSPIETQPNCFRNVMWQFDWNPVQSGHRVENSVLSHIHRQTDWHTSMYWISGDLWRQFNGKLKYHLIRNCVMYALGINQVYRSFRLNEVWWNNLKFSSILYINSVRNGAMLILGNYIQFISHKFIDLPQLSYCVLIDGIHSFGAVD